MKLWTGMLSRALLLAAGLTVAALSAWTVAALALAGGYGAARLALPALLFFGALTFSHALGRAFAAGALLLVGVAPGLALVIQAQLRHGLAVDSVGAIAALLAAVLAGATGGAWLTRRDGPWQRGHSVAVLFTLAAVMLVVLGPVMIRFPVS